MNHDISNNIYELNQVKNDIDRLKIIFEASKEGLWYMDPNNNVSFYNTNFYENFAVSIDNSNLSEWLKLLHPVDKKVLENSVVKQVSEKIEIFKCQYRVLNKNGDYVWIEALGKTIFDENRNMLFMVGSHTDITERKLFEAKILNMAYHDDLTGLYNRNKIKEILGQELSNNNYGALLYIDINNFKAINETLTYKMGDEVLKKISSRIRSSIDENYSLARASGDEFLVLLKGVVEDDIETYAQNILDIIRNEIYIDGRLINLDACIGIAKYPYDGNDVDEIIQNANLITSVIKENEKRGYSFYSDRIKKSYLRKISIEQNLIKALDDTEFYLQYQPLIDVHSPQNLLGFEALLRWKSKELGDVYPDEFIPIAEKNLTINFIGDYVLEKACQFGTKLIKLNKPSRISVNVSAIQLYQSNFVEKVLNIITKTGFDKELLDLEITESVTLESDNSVVEKIKQLNREGINISLDDFGTGYSSINNIISLPLAYLKVDMSVIKKVNESEDASLLIELLVNYSHRMNYKIIAEGIEDERILSKMRLLNVDYAQGYYFSKPKDERDILAQLA